ncbi:MAG TPA: helix-turn-helix domain-containing protein [Moraxellaceae bacterium]|nr:helix-turn-helix domain-containing protein [Moraxellaceae bacterium]
MPAHVFAQLLESDILGAEAVGRFRAIIAREGVDLAAMLTPGAQLPIRWFREAYPALDADQAASIGYFSGEQARLTSYSLLSLPLVSAGSVSEVMRLLAFMPLISNVISARFLEQDDAVLVMLSVDSGDPLLDRIPVFYSAAALVHLLRMLSSDPLNLSIYLTGPAPAALRNHPEVIAGRLHFDAPVNLIRVPRATLAAVCRFSDPIAYESALAGLQTMLDARGRQDDIASHVRQLLDEGPGLQKIDQIADMLNLSVSTLKRRLAECGTSFSALLEGVLRDRARLMLLDASMTLDDISASLGYSDLANFSHAFKRWTGRTPGAFRRDAVLQGAAR